MKQNLAQLEEILALRVPEPEIGAPFRPQRHFAPAQWVDVKDTVGEWLEAQVVRSEPTRLLVHYNGWGPRWDEWITVESGRVAPFRTHTVQSPSSPFLSPFPVTPPDAGTSMAPHDSTFDDMLRLFCNLLLAQNP